MTQLAEDVMPKTNSDDGVDVKPDDSDVILEFRREETVLKMSALQDAIFNSDFPEVDIKSGLQAGFFDYLTKPIKINGFMAVLDKALALPREKSANKK